MNLKSFLTFRQACYVCGAPIVYSCIDWTDMMKPTVMLVQTLVGAKWILKLSHDGVAIFVSLKKNTYIVTPHNENDITILMQASCSKTDNHYSLDTQMVKLNASEHCWNFFPMIDVEEIISLDGYESLFSIVSSYERNTTTVIYKDGMQSTLLPLISSKDTSFQDLNGKIKTLVTFQ